MDKFLELAYVTQIMNNEDVRDAYDYFKPLMSELEKMLDKEECSKLGDIVLDCAVECVKYYGISGMKLAISIMEDKYVPVV